MTTTTVSGTGNSFTGTVQAGDEMVIADGATSTNALIYGTEIIGGLERVYPPVTQGDAQGSIVEAGGTLVDTGNATGCTVLSGGTMTVGPSAQEAGSASGDFIYGHETVVGEYASVSGETVYAGGTLAVQNDANASNITLDGGTMTVEGSGASFITIAGGSLFLLPATEAEYPYTTFGSGDLTFSGPGGLLDLNGQIDGFTIHGFGAGDAIVVNPGSISVTGDTVTVGGVTLDIAGAGSLDLALGVVDGMYALECVCFLAGTTIATPEGGRAIETLATGDLVLTASGEAQPVRWLGRQTIVTRFADPLRVAPIRIRAGALGENLPARDLLVSPDHALMVDGVFVQAGALVNAVSITREDRNMPERFTYFHVELADHSLILAENVAAESFIDNVDRLAFDNWHAHAAPGDTTAPMHEMPHPRAKAHRQVPAALRQRLMTRGLALAGIDAATAA